MLLRYDDGPDEVVIPAAGNLLALRGEPVEVPDAVAGAAPGPWAPVDAPNWDDGQSYRQVDGLWEKRTPGSGLLAQDDVWRVV